MTSLVFDSITLNNFKSFRGEHTFPLDRPPGLYYIAGRNKEKPRLDSNSVGKTSLWDALNWVLYGRTGRDNRPSNSVIPWGMDKGMCSISLRFFRGDDEYKLTRTRRPNELKLQTYKPNTLSTVIDEEVVRLIMPEETFRRTMVLGQFGQLFLDMAPEQQSRMFNDALSLDLWLKASKMAATEQDARESSARQAWGGVTALKGRLTELAENLTEQEQASENYAANQAKKVDDAKAGLATLRKELEKSLFSADLPGLGRGKPGVAMAGLMNALASARDAQDATRTAAEKVARINSQLRTKLRDLDQNVAAYDKAIKGNRACPECGQTAPITHLKDKLATAKAAYAETMAERDKLEKTIKKLGQAQTAAETKVAELDRIARQAQSLAGRIEGQETRLAELADAENPHDQQIVILRERETDIKQQIDGLTEKAQRLEKEAGECALWVDAFREIRLSLIDTTLDELEIATDRHVESLGLEGWSIKFQTERETKSGNVSAVFTTLLYPPDAGGEPIRWQSYSGGESQRWQMATAFGLSEVLLARSGVEPNILVLDEPTKGMSPNGVDDLLECLKQYAIENKRVVYFVDHHSLDKGMFNGMITVEKTKAGSRILEGT